MTGFFIILEVAMTLGVQFTPGKKDDKQCVAISAHLQELSESVSSKCKCR